MKKACGNRSLPEEKMEWWSVEQANEEKLKRKIIRLLTILEIIPLKLFLTQWCWVLHKLGRI